MSDTARLQTTAPATPRHAETVRAVERAAVLLLLALLLFGVLRVLEPFAVAILFGAFIAVGTWPLRDALVRAGLRRGPAAGLMLLLLGLLVALPTLAMAPGLAVQLKQGAAMVQDLLAHAPEQPPDWVAKVPIVGDDAQRAWPHLREAQGNIRTLLAPYSDAISSNLIALGRGVVESLVQLLLALIVTTAFWLNGDRMVEQLRHLARRLGGTVGVATVSAAGGALRGVAWGVVGTAILQGVLMGLGLAIAGVPGAATIGFLAFVCSISQVLGPLVVVGWAAAAWWLHASGESAWAVFMLLWGAILVSGSDNIVRPVLMSRGSAMPLTLIILGVFGGMLAFGFLGLFVGPALLAVAHALLKAWREAPHDADPAA
jgi:predicted PurR-regulated permease PerM